MKKNGESPLVYMHIQQRHEKYMQNTKAVASMPVTHPSLEWLHVHKREGGRDIDVTRDSNAGGHRRRCWEYCGQRLIALA